MKCKIFNSLWLVTEVGCGLFPTSVCGVLVFGSVSCHLSVSASRPRPQSFTRIQLCHTQSLTTLSGAVSHTILYNFVTHTISFTHNFVTRTHTQSLSHTTSSRTITHTTLSDTTLSRTIFRGHLFHILSHICFCVAGVALCDIDWSGLGTAGFVAGMALGDIDSSL